MVNQLQDILERDDALEVPDLALVAAVSVTRFRCDTDLLESFLQRDGGLGTTGGMIRAAKNPEALSTILSHRPICRITLDMLDYIASTTTDRELLQMLLDHEEEIPITEEIVPLTLTTRSTCERRGLGEMSGAAQHFLERLFERNRDLAVTPTMLKKVKYPDDMEILLKYAPDLQVTPEILKAAASTFEQGEKLVPMLLAYDKSVKVPQAVLTGSLYKASPDTVNYHTLLLERSPELALTAELLTDIVNNPPCGRFLAEGLTVERLAELFHKYKKKVAFTDALHKAIENRFQGAPRIKALLYRLEEKDSRAP